MIESLFNPKKIKSESKKRMEIFIAGIIFTLIGALFAINIVPPGPEARGLGFLVVAFICIPAAPFFVQLLKIEVKEDVLEKPKSLLWRHMDVIEIFGYFFLAVVFASSLFYVVAPVTISESVFQDQIGDLTYRGVITGDATREAAGSASSGLIFTEVLGNNLVVLALAFVFSFVLGAGAIFLISWNATVVGALIGKIAENPVLFGSVETGNIFINYLVALPVTLLRLLPHGIFEIVGYFIGAIAGGILSAGIIRESHVVSRTRLEDLEKIIIDSSIYFGVAVLFIVIGAFIECFV